MDRIASEPLQTAVTWELRYPRLWIGTRTDAVSLRLDRKSIGWTILKVGFFALNLLILTVGLGGLWRSRHDRAMHVLAVPILYVGIVLIPFHNTETRYS